jgi:hypothetical protein
MEVFAAVLLAIDVVAVLHGSHFILLPISVLLGFYPLVVRWRVRIIVDDSNVYIGAIIGSGRVIPRDRVAGILQYYGQPGGVAFIDRDWKNLGSTSPMWSREQLKEMSIILDVPLHNLSYLSRKKSLS